MNQTVRMDVTRKVVIEQFTDHDGCGLCADGWFWHYEGDQVAHGPYRSMDEAMSAADRGP